jgi:hypothetical protein
MQIVQRFLNQREKFLAELFEESGSLFGEGEEG